MLLAWHRNAFFLRLQALCGENPHGIPWHRANDASYFLLHNRTTKLPRNEPNSRCEIRHISRNHNWDVFQICWQGGIVRDLLIKAIKQHLVQRIGCLEKSHSVPSPHCVAILVGRISVDSNMTHISTIWSAKYYVLCIIWNMHQFYLNLLYRSPWYVCLDQSRMLLWYWINHGCKKIHIHLKFHVVNTIFNMASDWLATGFENLC